MKRSRITRALDAIPQNLKLGALLASMPSAQSVASDTLEDLRRDTPMLRVLAFSGQGAKTPFPVVVRPANRIRFIYIVEHVAPEAVDVYHDLLVKTEVLLDRLFNAQAIGLRPLDLQLGLHHHRQLVSRPPRGVFTALSPEYRRWYTEHGSTRVLPLTREALIVELCRLDGLTPEAARAAATHRSWALPQAAQDWLIARSEVEAMHRPLHRDDMDGLARTLEAILGPHALPSRTERIVETNRQIAVRTAAALGSMVDTFAPPPFAAPELAEAFAVAHAAHLGCLASLSALPPVTNAAAHWFLAKRNQIKAMVARHTQSQIADAIEHSAPGAVIASAMPPVGTLEPATLQPGYTDWYVGDGPGPTGASRAPIR